MIDALRGYVNERLEAGETPSFGNRTEDLTVANAKHLDTILDRLNVEGLKNLRDELAVSNAQRIDVAMLNSVGQLWTASVPTGCRPALLHEGLESVVHRVLAAITSDPPQSVIPVSARRPPYKNP